MPMGPDREGQIESLGLHVLPLMRAETESGD
jgi:hypothetical protein